MHGSFRMHRIRTLQLGRHCLGQMRRYRRYEYFFSVEDEETVLLVDSWDNQAAIDLHHASSIMDQITELRIKYHLHMKVERYFLDETGIPKEDQKFIQK